jgi:hypothetical protein
MKKEYLVSQGEKNTNGSIPSPIWRGTVKQSLYGLAHKQTFNPIAISHRKSQSGK